MTTDGATAGEALTAETLAAMYRTASATCARCGEPATCLGAYEGAETEQYGCDECCGHGNEDGHCEAVGDVDTLRTNTLALIREVRRLTAALDGVRREERERCAKVADESAALWQRPMGASGRVIPERMETGHAVALVAVQIRALPDDATGSAT